MARRNGGAQTCKWSFTQEARDYFNETKVLANRGYHDLHSRPDIPGSPTWRRERWAHWTHDGTPERVHPILEEMIRRMVTGAWTEELIRIEETREAVVDRFMGRARDKIREEIFLAATARVRRELAGGVWEPEGGAGEPKDNGKFG